MQPLRSVSDLAALPGPIALGIGVFDGVHVGHQAVIAATLAAAKNAGGTAVIVSFDPHPARILRPEQSPRLLTSTAHKLQLLKDLGVQYVLLVEFNREFSSRSPEDFITLLAKSCRPLATICVGEDWAFGRDRSGNVSLLEKLGHTLHFSTFAVPAIMLDGQIVSSTLIRRSVETGHLETAARYLGRPYTILGTIVRGKQLGRTIGFPTANISAHNEQFPPDGVYAIRARLSHEFFVGVANIGMRPTIASALPDRQLEVHLFDFQQDIYGRDLEISFVKFIRPETKFPSLEALRAQISADSETARDFLAAKLQATRK